MTLATALLFFAADAQTAESVEEILVLGDSSWSQVSTNRDMLDRQSPLASVNTAVDSLAGIYTSQGGAFGLDDWSSTISMRGYQLGLSEQQLGVTIDGIPNGESSFIGGSRANRYIDAANLRGVSVSQGSADISSRSVEALGGTLDYLTALPLPEQRVRLQYAGGSFGASRYYARYDTGQVLGDTTSAWISASRNAASDWISGTADNYQKHLAARFRTSLDRLTIDGYVSRDNAHEDNYERISRAQFDANPLTDGLSAVWTGVPYLDQQYRRGWSTLRKNLFSYLKFDYALMPSLDLGFSIYSHKMQGRGDWMPPYIPELVSDGDEPHSELQDGFMQVGGSPLGLITFTDATGRALSPLAGCVSSITYPYGGAGPEFDPGCHAAGAVAQQSYRHTHQKRERNGAMADFSHTASAPGIGRYRVRGGYWYERSLRRELRDWHRISDTRVGYDFEAAPYWLQLHNRYGRELHSVYLAADMSPRDDLDISLGVRQLNVDTDKRDVINETLIEALESDSGALFSAGLVYQLPVDGLEVFAGYAENTKPLSETVLATAGNVPGNPDAEQAVNRELGLRYARERLRASAVYFDSKFDNRLVFFEQDLDGDLPDYLAELNGSFDNLGGIRTRGIELTLDYLLHPQWNLYGAYSRTRARYLGAGLGAEVDNALGIVPDNRVAATPRDMLVLSLNWQHGAYSAGVTGKYVGKRFFDIANTTVAGAYTVVDANVAVSLGAFVPGVRQAQASLTLTNLADERYQGGIVGEAAWTGAPRAVVLTLTADF